MRRNVAEGSIIYRGVIGVLILSIVLLRPGIALSLDVTPNALALESMFRGSYASPAMISNREEMFRRQFREDAFEPWRFAEWARSYAAMYESSRDKTFLKALAELIKIAMANRDDRLGRPDALTRGVIPAWGTMDPFFRVRTVRVGSAALVLSSASKLVQILRKAPELSEGLAIDVDALEKDIMQSLSPFDHLYRVRRSENGDLGYYVQPSEIGGIDCRSMSVEPLKGSSMSLRDRCTFQAGLAETPEAYNIDFLVGEGLVYLRRQDGLAKVSQIERYFFKTSGFAIKADTESAVFAYKEGGRVEDVSHLNVDVAFFLAIYDSGGASAFKEAYPVNEELLGAFARAVSESSAVRLEVPLGSGGSSFMLTPYIDGSRARDVDKPDRMAFLLSARNSRIRRACGQFLELVFVERRLAAVCWDIMKSPGMLTPLGLSHLARGLRRPPVQVGSARERVRTGSRKFGDPSTTFSSDR